MDEESMSAAPAAATATMGSGPKAKKSKSRVVELTSDTFLEKTQSGEWLVQFYAPWCGFCKRLGTRCLMPSVVWRRCAHAGRALRSS
jgi:thiol-disulfide isomerase/thioredoxin